MKYLAIDSAASDQVQYLPKMKCHFFSFHYEVKKKTAWNQSGFGDIETGFATAQYI
jgi:hypothetical protein